MSQLSNTLALRGNPKAFLEGVYCSSEQPLTFFTLLGGRRCAVLREPSLVEEVLLQEGLQTGHATYEKPSVSNRISEVILGGPSVLTFEGAPWSERRKLLKDPFSPKAVARRFGEVFLLQTQQLISELEQGEDQPFDVVPVLQRLALRNGVTALFPQSALQPGDVEAVRRGVQAVDRHFMDEFSRLVPLPFWVKTPPRRTFAARTAPMRAIVRRIISQQRADLAAVGPGDRVDSLSLPALLLQAGLTDQAVESELLALLMAGYQTTALALSWCLHLLATHPQLQEQIAAALAEPPVVTITDFGLPQLKHVVEETLRLYPSVWFTFRETTRPTELGEFSLRKGTWLFISPFLLHRDSRIWEQPDEFIPKRFESPHPRGAYIPFIRGPHACLGQHFALLEMQVVLGALLRRFTFQSAPGYGEPIPTFKSVITPLPAIMLTVRGRGEQPRMRRGVTSVPPG
jgi:cytochrome P450